MSSSKDEQTLTATSGLDSDSESEQSSEIESSDSDSDEQVPLATLEKRAKTTQSIRWKDTDNFPRRFGCHGTTGVQVPGLNELSEATEIFENFFPPELVAHIADETNRYAALKPKRQSPSPSHMREWFDTTPDEMSVFLAMTIIIGIMPKPDLKLYWTRDPVFETPFFPNTMPRDRFMELLFHLHLRQADTNDRLYKVRPVIDTLTENFKSVYLPDSRISMDESLWKFKGRLKFKQFNPKKRARFGIKVYRVCQSTGAAAGYTWNLKIYTGQDKSDTPASTKIVLDLNADLLGKGYTVFLDNWFSSPSLFLELHSHKTNVVGTVRKNRKDMPKDLCDLQLRKGEVAYRSSDKGLLALVWKDKKDVRMLSTMHTAAMGDSGKCDRYKKSIEKPKCVIDYNTGMKGLDM
ncbi:piggyBac transposable element-derived protein 4-like [Patiria miniata]|uniref:PiggyBac transposable element-derived protein domain-containing protein n=1 Tax=Patiria miniata TaxID=46514 RepID=A0A914B6Y4_PATMI|nr:piggyBac transposable element-derived protein 4-like [Patiria miniata]